MTQASCIILGSDIFIDPNTNSLASIANAAATIAFGMMSYYTGNNSGDNPGNLPDPYYWWEAGAMFGSMVDYWYYTNDTSYVNVTVDALISQIVWKKIQKIVDI